MILVLGGTGDASAVARTLKEHGVDVRLTAVSEYGASMSPDDVAVLDGQLDASRLSELMIGVHGLVDASHPFATRVSRIAIQVCAEKRVPYVRFERPYAPLPPMADVVMAAGADKAAVYTVQLAEHGTIFLAVGTDGLETYLDAARAGRCRVVVRVPPTAEALGECERLGVQPWDVVGIQGPTTPALETELMRRVDSRVVVTKEGGTEGSVLNRLRAARTLNIPAVVVARPRMEYPHVVGNVDDLLAVLEQTGVLADAEL
jgi:precorrin-6A/cobalt-precorrin-6A reductase